MNDYIHISYKKFNPNFHHLKEALKDDDLRFIFLRGGSSSAKSFSIAQCFLLECLTKGYNTKVYRKTGASIADSIYKTFEEAARSLNIYHLFRFVENRIVCFNGSYITFSGLDNSEKIKGLESYQYVFCEEINELEITDFKQIKKRLRGRKGQKIVSAFNPVSEDLWIKKEIFDKDSFHELDNSLYGKLKDENGKVLPKEFSEVYKKMINSERVIFNPRKKKEEKHNPDTLVLWSTYLNNFWVVGSPCGTYGYYDRQTIADFEKDKVADYNYYRIYALGEWGSIKTGGEFLHAFNAGKHKKICKYDSTLPIHISIDDNLLPYISITFWQAVIGPSIEIKQIHEICAEDPFNTVSRAGAMAKKWLDDIGYKDIVFIHGDASTQKGNTIDEEKRSFLDKFIEKIEDGYHVTDCVPKSNPSVSMSGEFINAILSGAIPGVSISIGETCTKSIHDYENVKKDENGAMLKARVKNKLTKQTYEEFGHLTDTMRYVCVDLLKNEYIRFSLKRKRNKTKKEDIMKYYPSQKGLSGIKIACVMPDCNGKFIMLNSIVGFDRIYIEDVLYQDYFDSVILEENLKKWNPKETIFESNKSYFPIVRSLREWMDDIRAISECAKTDVRISANFQLIKEKIFFRDDYEELGEYNEFMESIMDYNGKDNNEAINCLSALSSYVFKKHLCVK